LAAKLAERDATVRGRLLSTLTASQVASQLAGFAVDIERHAADLTVGAAADAVRLSKETRAGVAGVDAHVGVVRAQVDKGFGAVQAGIGAVLGYVAALRAEVAEGGVRG